MTDKKLILQGYKDNKFEDIILHLKEKTKLNLKLIGYAECESLSAKSFEISDSLKASISNIKDTRIYTNQPLFNQNYIYKTILLTEQNNNLYQNTVFDEYNDSKIYYTIFDKTHYKDILQLLNTQMDYIFVFSEE